MLDRIDISDFRCVKKLSLPLTPIHALIGPNDAGKSTLLRAIKQLAEAGRRGADPGPGLVGVSDGIQFGRVEDMSRSNAAVGVGQPAIVRWVPDSLRQMSPNVVHVEEFLRSGVGLAAMFSRAFNANETALAEVNRRLSSTFPSIAKLRVEPASADWWRLAVTLRDGRRVEVEELSDGVLYWLAFESLRYLENDWLLLLEEPENGLHPSRIAEVMATIKSVVAGSKGHIQVVMATHSPLIINELNPDEVTLITRDVEQGTQATPMRATQNFEERAKVYALGELWLSFADGRDEAALVPSATDS